MSGTASAQQSIMVAGDSISAGFNRPSYRLPLLDSLSNYGCTVSMVGDQTLNDFNYKQAPGPNNGRHFPGFSPADGYDTNHQAFPGLTTDQVAFGVSNNNFTVSPISTYVSGAQPDFVLVHLGSNDMATEIFFDRLNTDAEVNRWANVTIGEMRRVIDRIISVHNQPSDLRILVANFIPYAAENATSTQLFHAKRASRLFTQRLESLVLDRSDARVAIVDVESGFNPASMTYDGLHPNAVGEEHIAGAFLSVLRGEGLCPNTPLITSPAPGSSISGESAVIRWSNNGRSVNNWRVRVGTSQSGSSSTYYYSGNLPANTRSVNVPGLPADQSNLFVSLEYTDASGTDQVISSFFNRAVNDQLATPGMSAPLAGSQLPGSTVNFSWNSNGRAIRQWWVRVGSTPGGTEYFDSERITDKSTRSVSVTGLPTDGSPVYFELNGRPSVDPWITRIFTYRAAGGSAIPSKVLQNNEWYQISLPFNPGSNNRVRDIFGSSLPLASYADNGNNGNWTLFRYDARPGSQSNDRYVQMTRDDRLEVGRGYWILQRLGRAVTINAPAGAPVNGSNVNSTQRSACENTVSCYALPANGVVTDGRSGRFTMLGSPLANPTGALQARVATSFNMGCSGTRDCSLAEAYQKDVLFHTLSVWNPAQVTYTQIGPISGVLNPWDGFWAAQLPSAGGQNASLILSEPAAAP